MEWLATAANRGSVVTGPYEIDNSLKFEDANDEYLTRTNASGTNRRTFTVSLWCKRTKLGGTQELWDGGVHSEAVRIGFGLSSDELWLDIGYSDQYRSKTTQQFRDPSAWYHIVWKVDTTQSTEADRFRVYVNGAEITDWAQRQYPPQNFDSAVHAGTLARIGSYNSTYHGFCGYMADFNYLDGLAVGPDSFGEYDEDSAIWIPKKYTGSYPGQSAYLDFGDSSDLGANSKGDDVNFTTVNLAAINQATDTPTNNFCIINPLFDNNFAIWSLTEGGTRGPNTGEGNGSVGTFGVDSGKWYWEGVTTAFSGTNYWKWGITRVDVAQGNSADPSTDANSTWYTGDNAYYTQTSTSASDVSYNTGFTGYTAGDIWSVSLNCDVSPYQMTFRINNAVPGTTSNNTNRSVGTYASADAVLPFFMLANSSSDNTWHNFGNPFISTLSGGNSDANGYGDFKYAPPSGYYALCTKNLAEFG